MEEGLIRGLFDPDEIDVRTYSPLTLAFMGDAVFELMARTLVVTESNTAPTAEEQSVYRRGRNAQSYTHAKNASVSDYRHATGLEALFGYLYLTGQQGRMMELMKRCVEILEEKPQ